MMSFSHGRILFLVASIIGFAVALFVALVPFSSPEVGLKEGEISSRTIRAPNDISFVSPVLTARRQQEAANAVQDTLVFDPSVATGQQTLLNTVLQRIRSVIEDPTI